jgi:hypothetical protein
MEELEGRTGRKNWKKEPRRYLTSYLTPFDFVFPLSFSTHFDSLSLSLSLSGNVTSSVPGDFHDDAKEANMPEAEELNNPAEAYSIEDAKLKTEEDNKRKEADIKKDGVRNAIVALRTKYMALFKENQAAPLNQRLSSEQCALDMSVVERLVSAGDAKCEEVEKIFRWER